MVLRNTIVRLIGKCCDFCCKSDNKAEKRAELSTYSVSEDLVAELKFGPLYEFYKRAEFEYKEL